MAGRVLVALMGVARGTSRATTPTRPRPRWPGGHVGRAWWGLGGPLVRAGGPVWLPQYQGLGPGGLGATWAGPGTEVATLGAELAYVQAGQAARPPAWAASPSRTWAGARQVGTQPIGQRPGVAGPRAWAEYLPGRGPAALHPGRPAALRARPPGVGGGALACLSRQGRGHPPPERSCLLCRRHSGLTAQAEGPDLVARPAQPAYAHQVPGGRC